MPELPEVETVRRGLTPVMEGATITRVEARRPDLRFPLPVDFAGRLTGRRINALSRRAKYLLADLDNGNVLIMHLGMSGSFRIAEERVGAGQDAMPGEFHHDRSKLPQHDHVVFHLENAGRRFTVTYNDPRRFGFMDLITADHLADDPRLAGLGIEPTGNRLDGKAIAQLFAGKTTPLKAALLDQRLIAGIGNIYACEALWQAGLSPKRLAGSIVKLNGGPTERCNRLAEAIRDVIGQAIKAGGSSLRDHRQTDGSLGYFQHRFKVYDREGEPCQRPGCGGTIKRIVQSGRSTFHCPSCQR